VRRFSQERNFQLNISLGLNSGDIVAGIVGRNKFIYDVWGDTINIASALKSACTEGTIFVSNEIYNRLCDLYEFVPVAAKVENGKNILKAWQLKSTTKTRA
jgi:class 3 adenylate cyclase